MSSRHQTTSKPDKSDRRVEHHRERQATRAALDIPDLDEVLDPPSVHNNAVPGTDSSIAVTHHEYRHGKPSFWKRHTSRH